VVAIEHAVGILARLADRVVVLDEGRVIADGPAAGVLASAPVREAYLGD
jgi:branched-chain amino acid transport system ATP-binding protein